MKIHNRAIPTHVGYGLDIDFMTFHIESLTMKQDTAVHSHRGVLLTRAVPPGRASGAADGGKLETFEFIPELFSDSTLSQSLSSCLTVS